jgi:hypothetical protein
MKYIYIYIFKNIPKIFFKNSPKVVTKAVKKQMGVAHVISFAPIFCYDFISIFFIGTQYMMFDGKKNGLKKNTTKTLTSK